MIGKNAPILFYYAKRPAWNVSLGESQRLPVYFAGRPEQIFEAEELNQLNEAMQDDVKWLEYLRGLGATHVVLAEKGYLERFPTFKNYLLKNHRQIQSEHAGFYFFEIQKNEISRKKGET